LTYPKSTMRVRRMPMHLSSGHVTLMPGKFYPPPIFPSQTQDAGRTHVGLCPKFLVCVWVMNQYGTDKQRDGDMMLVVALRSLLIIFDPKFVICCSKSKIESNILRTEGKNFQ